MIKVPKSQGARYVIVAQEPRSKVCHNRPRAKVWARSQGMGQEPRYVHEPVVVAVAVALRFRNEPK